MCSRVAKKCIVQLITQFIEIPMLHSFKFCLNYIYIFYSHVKHGVVVRMLSVCCAVLDCRQLSHCKPEVGQDITLATQYVLYGL